jgi:hypothetical protein
MILKKKFFEKKINNYSRLEYNIKSKYSYLFNNKKYIYSQKEILSDIINFIEKYIKKK